MQLLPRLVTTHGSFALPISDLAAQHVLAALGADDTALVARRLSSALADDAPLALWTVCRAAQRSQTALLTLESLAQ
jgi:hypothetical protein